ncbi:MAG: DUF2513 domain-containing protein [bacterium]|nr:DUF2513 domain-containing protein [bacterium]
MRRSQDLIYQLLTHVEENTNGPVEVPRLRGYTTKQVHNHVRLCIEAGYIEADKPGFFQDERVEGGGLWYYQAIHRLTWHGHDVLDEMRRNNGH